MISIYSSFALLLAGILPSAANAAATPFAISVVAEGADPTGKMDSSTAFTNAIKSGFAVLVPAGQYLLKTPVSLKSGLVLNGVAGQSILLADPANKGAGGGLLLVGEGVENVSVTGLIFDGNLANLPKPAPVNTRLVYIDGGKNVVFESNTWQNSYGSALVFSGHSGPIQGSGVTNSQFTNLGFGWRQYPNGTLSETAPVVVFSNGMSVTNLNNFVTSNQIWNVGSDAVSVQQQTNFVAEGNSLNLQGAGWKPTNAQTAVSYGVGGIYIFNAVNGVIVSGNVVEGATGNCLDLGEITNLRVIHNVVAFCGGAGIALGSNTDSFSITSNYLFSNYQSAGYPYPNVLHQGSLSFSCGQEPCQGIVSNGSVAGNWFLGQNPPQSYNAWKAEGVTLTNVTTDVAITSQQQ